MLTFQRSLSISCALTFLLLAPPVVLAQLPRTISYQGVLTDPAGNLLPDGTHALALTLYDAAAAGTAVFTEAQNVVVVRGTFNAILGGATTGGVPASVAFDRAYFLGVSVDGGAELTPRVPLTATPYALRAAVADRAILADQVQDGSVGAAQLADGAVETAKLADDAIVSTKLADGAVGTSKLAAGAVFGAAVLDRGITAAKLDGAGATAGQVLTSNGTTVGFADATLKLPFVGTTSSSTAVSLTASNVGLLGITTGAFYSDAGVNGRSTAGQSVGVYGESNAAGVLSVGVLGVHQGAGVAGWFQSDSLANSQPAVHAIHQGQGVALRATSLNLSSANIADFGAGSTTVARIDITGRGFFNGGTQSGGADIAEAFDVIGETDAYEPGDVLVIAVSRGRTMERSATPYSTLVAGVYATKPGVLLTERDVNADHSDTVPLGVVGVIPTKVSVENGAIRIGDLLVTSSTPGHAMRAGAQPPAGSILGKALEPFEGAAAATGRIRVLVGVR